MDACEVTHSFRLMCESRRPLIPVPKNSQIFVRFHDTKFPNIKSQTVRRAKSYKHNSTAKALLTNIYRYV